MKFLYIDASGDPGRPKPNGNSTTNFYCLFGISIDPEKHLPSINKEVNSIIDKYFPQNPPAELKYSWLIGGKNEYSVLDKPTRKKLADDIFNIIKEIEPTLFGVVIEKKVHYEKYVSPIDPREYALRVMLGRFTKYLERISEFGVVIADSEDKKTTDRLRNAELDFRKNGIVMLPSNSNYSSRNKLQLLVENILYQDSKASRMVQLADFGAYVLASKYERHKDRRFNELKPFFDRANNECYGLYVWPPKIEPTEYGLSELSYNPIFDDLINDILFGIRGF